MEKQPAERFSIRSAVLFAIPFVVSLAAAVFGYVMESNTPAVRVDPNMKSNGFWAIIVLLPAAACLAFSLWLLFAGKIKNEKRFAVLSCLVVLAVLGVGGLLLFNHFHLFLLLRPKVFIMLLKHKTILSCCVIMLFAGVTLGSGLYSVLFHRSLRR